MNPRQNKRGARRSKRAESAARRGTIPPPLCPKLTVPVVRDLRHGARSASVLARPVSLRYAALLFFSLASRGGAFSIDHLWARESRNPSVRGDQAGMPKRAAGGRFRVLRPPPPAQYPKTQTRNVGRYFQKIFPRTFPSADAFFCIQLNGTKSNPPGLRNDTSSARVAQFPGLLQDHAGTMTFEDEFGDGEDEVHYENTFITSPEG